MIHSTSLIATLVANIISTENWFVLLDIEHVLI